MNTVLLFTNILIGTLAVAGWLSPKFKFRLGYRLQVSARADWEREKFKQALLSEFEEPSQ